MSYSSEISPIQEGLARLSKQAGFPYILIASSWRSPRSHDLDELAARIFLEVLRAEPDRTIGLALLSRGGFASFADTARRALAARSLEDAIVLTDLSGASSAIALLARTLSLRPGAGVGAPAIGPVGPLAPAWNPEELDLVREDLFSLDDVDRRRVLSLARMKHERALLARSTTLAISQKMTGAEDTPKRTALSNALSPSELGAQVALGVGELSALGLDASWLTHEQDVALTPMVEALEELLGLSQEPPPAYTASGIGTEVEFELATGEPGAIIASTTSAWILELDTGRPDPDTGLYLGDWLEVRQ